MFSKINKINFSHEYPPTQKLAYNETLHQRKMVQVAQADSAPSATHRDLHRQDNIVLPPANNSFI